MMNHHQHQQHQQQHQQQQRLYSVNAACAACKHQRKKCDTRCLLSPYFPAEKSREFLAVHRVFGVSNTTKMMLAVREADRTRLIDSLVWEALMRQRDPVQGIQGEYKRVLDELLYFKTLAQNNVVQMQQQQAEEINRIGNNDGIIVSSSAPVPVPVPLPVSVTGSSDIVEWNHGNNPWTNLVRAGVVSAIANESTDKRTQAQRESESCIIDVIPYSREIHHHLPIKDENKEREAASNPSVVGYKQHYYISVEDKQGLFKAQMGNNWA